MIKIGSEYKYTLTRTCLKSGVLNMPASMKGLFPEEGESLARDAQNSTEYTIKIIDKRRVMGFKDFIEANNLIVNDSISILLGDDGHYVLKPVKRVRTVKKAYNPVDLDSVLDKIYRAEISHSEPEIAELYGVTDTAQLNKKLTADSRFEYHSGRWHIVRSNPATEDLDYTIKEIRADDATDKATKPVENTKIIRNSPPKTSNQPNNEELSSAQNDVKELFRALGFGLTVLDRDKMSIKINLGRRKYGVLIYLMEESSSLDWTALLNQRRSLGLDYVAIFADRRDLIRLVSPANSARISLWSWQAFYRLADYSKTVAISPFDLEPHFASDGLFEKGFEKFEARVREIISTRGRFSAVLESLAAMKASTVFLLDDVQIEDCSREDILKVLDLLEHSPFQIVQKIAPAEFFLRQAVSEALNGFAQYALSLKSRLPKRSSLVINEESHELAD